MKLTDTAIKNAKPKEKSYKMSDGDGMFVLIHINGSKYWRMKYYFAGKEKILALGVYPDVGLADARERRTQARKVLAAGNDPGAVKKEAKRLAIMSAENNFEAIAREWHEKRGHVWTPKYSVKILNRLKADIFPKLGSRPITDIKAPELLSTIMEIEKRGALYIAHRAIELCSQIFTYAIVTGRAERNPAADLRGALKPAKPKHYSHLKAEELPEFLQKLENYQGHIQTKLALKMLMYTFVRTVELRGAKWSEIDFDKAEWRIPAERMKMREQHIVPLSKQALAILRELQPVTGHWEHIFPNQQKPSGCMSENTMIYAIYRMGYHTRTTGHGFRHTASTILNEHGFKADVIERQLAHAERKKVRGTYNHAEYLPDRRKMMQWWANYLDTQATIKKVCYTQNSLTTNAKS